jgi:hypothetical protein
VFTPVRDRVFAPVFVSVDPDPSMIPDKVPDAVVTSMTAVALAGRVILLVTLSAETKARVVFADIVNVPVPIAPAAVPKARVPATREVPPE